MTCPLCTNKNSLRSVDSKELFTQCLECRLIFKPQSARLTQDLERARYESHENSIENKGYVDFLTPAADAVCARAKKGSQGLDYGCGPQPVLALLLNQKGFAVGYYDPFFFPEGLKLSVKKCDFITCTEAAEHFFNPGAEFARIFSLLKPDGFLVLMTEVFQENINIDEWYYAKDPTHVCFYSKETFVWIARKFNRKVQNLNPRLCVFS